MEAKGGRELLIRLKNVERVYVPTSNQSLELLPHVVKFLEKNGTSLSKISEIEVQTGTASFTTARQIVTLANMIHWLFGVKIVTVNDDVSEFLVPIYYAAPTITISKKSLV